MLESPPQTVKHPATYCSKCGKQLHEVAMTGGFDVHTGQQVIQTALTCKSLISNHDTYILRPQAVDLAGNILTYGWELR